MQKELILEGDSLDEVRRLVVERTPKGYSVEKETVLSDGKQRKATGEGPTIADAVAEAERGVPCGATEIERNVPRTIEEKEEHVEAFDEASARSAAQGLCQNGWTLAGLRLATEGRRGLLGIGRKPNSYLASLRKRPGAEILYRQRAKVFFLLQRRVVPLSFKMEHLSLEARTLVTDALAILESHVRKEAGFAEVTGAGSEGPVMEAAQKLDAARKLHADQLALHYAYVSALAAAAQNLSAKTEMAALASGSEDFVLARWAVAGWDLWESLFFVPPWGPETTSVPPPIAREVKTCVLLATRDGIVPRATLFFRDSDGVFADPEALRTARIEITAVLDEDSRPPVCGVFIRVWDDPSNAMNLEALNLPLSPRGHRNRRIYEHLCLQEDIDFAIFDRGNRIVLNRRLPIPPRMRKALDQLAILLDREDGGQSSPTEFQAALVSYQRKFEAAALSY